MTRRPKKNDCQRAANVGEVKPVEHSAVASPHEPVLVHQAAHRSGMIEHLKRLRGLAPSQACLDDKLHLRGLAKQRCRRELEEEVRLEAVGFSHWTRVRG